MADGIDSESVQWMLEYVRRRGPEADAEVMSYNKVNYSVRSILFEMEMGTPVGAYFSGFLQRMLKAREPSTLQDTSSAADV